MNKLKVINTVDVPRGGWSYKVDATNTVLQAGNIGSLKLSVRKHMIANALAIPPDLDEVVEDGACNNLDSHREHWCAERDPAVDINRESPKWGASEIKRFLTTIWSWGTEKGFVFVPAEEAERRAAICAICPANVPVSGCLGCTGVSALIRKIRGNHKTRFETKLNACNVCGCDLKVKVMLPLDVIDNKGLTYPSACWQSAPEQAQDPTP